MAFSSSAAATVVAHRTTVVPHLTDRFGPAYAHYRARIRRWL
jgi:hypothetical protein